MCETVAVDELKSTNKIEFMWSKDLWQSETVINLQNISKLVSSNIFGRAWVRPWPGMRINQQLTAAHQKLFL